MRVTPELDSQTPKRELGEAWRVRRSKYVRWLEDPETFFVIAEDDSGPVGYAFVTIGQAYASWTSGDRIAELETLSVLDEHRSSGVGAALIEAAWKRLGELGVDDMAITTTKTNVRRPPLLRAPWIQPGLRRLLRQAPQSIKLRSDRHECEHMFVLPKVRSAPASIPIVPDIQMSMLKQSLPPIEAGDRGRGEVFTRRWVVELILDLCGYKPDRDLASLTAIEPACGSGAFLEPMAVRVAESARIHGRDTVKAVEAIQARDIHKPHVLRSRAVVREALTRSGIDSNRAAILARRWVRQGDFLLEPAAEKSADFVLGNPPYIRLEAIPTAISNAYRQACPAMGGRADIYVGFYERGLHALRDQGVLGFICADRWMRNAYGMRLRELISREWSVEAILSMTEVDAFESEVDAYPAITVLRRASQDRGPLVVDATPEFDPDDAQRLIQATQQRKISVTSGGFRAARLSRWTGDLSGWPTGSPRQLAAITKIEATLPALEDRETGTKVGIGLATGADRIFITQDPGLVEPERTLPLAMVRDIASGKLDWSGHFLLNPWDENGLVNLREWPALRTYLTRHKSTLAKRHTARSGKWHKTIDRVINGLYSKEKLYLPDFKGALFPVLDRGESYPHHNLYWITSEKWDLELLGGILLSEVANLFIDSYSVRMRGGYLRFQAQYLRKIRVPNLDEIDRSSAAALRRAFREHDGAAATAAALPLYGLHSLPT